MEILTAGRRVNRAGGDELDWTPSAVSTVVEWGHLQPGGASEVADRGDDTQTADARLWLRAATVLTGSSRVRVAGVTYEVIGQPARWAAPGRVEHHVQAELRVVTG